MTRNTVYMVCGCTWPFSGSVWTSKRGAMRAAAELRRKLRAEFADAARSGTNGVLVEPRTRRDVASFWRVRS